MDTEIPYAWAQEHITCSLAVADRNHKNKNVNLNIHSSIGRRY